MRFDTPLMLATTLLVATVTGCGSSSDGDGGNAGATQVGGDGGVAQVGGGAGSSSGGQSAGTGGVSGSHADGGNASGIAGGGGGSGSVVPVQEHALACTERGACALGNSGQLECWGNLPSTWSIPEGPFVELHASGPAVCAVRADRTVACFDAPGSGSTSTATLAPKGKVQTLELGLGTMCGADDAGMPFCNSAYPGLAVPAAESFPQYSVGYEFACGRRADGTLKCWGNAGAAACSGGIPAAGQLAPPTGSFASVAGGVFSSCALDSSGAVSCWGAGKAGDDATASCGSSLYNFGQSTAPTGAFRALAVGENHSCGIKTDGTLACWGAGTADSDCPGDSVDCRQSRPPSGSFVQVSVGRVHSCAMSAERKVKCWGYPGAGAGDGRLTPPAEFQ